MENLFTKPWKCLPVTLVCGLLLSRGPRGARDSVMVIV
jgi:hypothetical protein